LFAGELSEEDCPSAARSEIVIIGNEVAAGQRPQVVVPGGVWQGCCLEPGGRFALMGTTMAPGFDYTDYEAGRREPLLAAFPEQADLIRRLTNG
jgi:predicted cupin superfamily sugar epimerase